MNSTGYMMKIIIALLLYFHQGKNKIIPCFNPNTLLPGEQETIWFQMHDEWTLVTDYCSLSYR